MRQSINMRNASTGAPDGSVVNFSSKAAALS
jgi:hypothetical protein